MVFRNIRGLVKNEPGLFAVMLITVFSSALLLYFSYGLYQNYNVRLIENSTEYKELVLEVGEGQTLTKGGLCSFVEALPRATADNVEIFLVNAASGSIADHRPVTEELHNELAEKYGGEVMTDEEGRSFSFDENTVLTDYNGAIFYFRFRYKDGGYKYIELPEESLHDGRTLISGRFWSDEEYNSGAHAAVGTSTAVMTNERLSFLFENGKVWLWGEQYDIIGASDANALPTPPITAAPDDLVLMPHLNLYFLNALTKTEYSDLKNTAEAVLPGMFRFEDISFPDRDSIYVYNNIILISLLIAVMSAVNFVMLYRCILLLRRRSLAIMRLCGCSLKRAAMQYIAECLVISVPAFAVGLGVFIPLMKHVLADIFPYMQGAYSAAVYALIFAAYIVLLMMLLAVTVSVNIRGSISAAVKKRG
ncbi:MAG: ABC transporter permease [Ruminococcus sp.]|nr:ABC transporter permease [Ruminococcus sp.]